MNAIPRASDTRNDDSRWQAVLDRDASRDGRFVYAVHSTGIFCRPSCPSRRPRRERVAFYPTPAAAERAGFRACRRCDPAGVGPRAERTELIAAACRYLDAHVDERVTLAALSKHIGYAPHHLLRLFQRVTGMTPHAYAAAKRVERLKGGLRERRGVLRATVDAGYGSSSRVYERAGERLGMSPGRYARGGAGSSIRWATTRDPLGALLVAATEHGLCAVRLGASTRALARELRQEYPNATLTRDARALAPWLEQLAAASRGGAAADRLPLDLAATVFQARVWQALRRIPAGETRTYAEVARSLGEPRAARAVARACASNPVALVIPCHRVVPAAGGAGGYRWGVARKRRLLANERRAVR